MIGHNSSKRSTKTHSRSSFFVRLSKKIATKFPFSLNLKKTVKDNLLVFFILIVCFGWLWGSVSAMTKNWELARQLEAKKRERTLLALEIELLELENKYFESEEYQELSARRQQGKMLDGETMVVLPDNSPSAKTKYQTPPKLEPKKLSNIQQWINFLLRKG